MEDHIVEYAGTYGQSGSSDVVSSVSTCEESPTTFQTFERDVTSVEFGPRTSAQNYSWYQEQSETCVPYELQRASPLLQPGAETSSEDGSFDILEAVVPNFFQGHQGTYVQCEQQQANQQLEAIAQMLGQDGPHGYQLHDFSQQQQETYAGCEQQLGYQQLAAETFGVDASSDFQLHDISQQLPEMHRREQQDGDQQFELAARTSGDDGSLDFDLNNVSQERQVIYVQFGQEQGNQQPSAQMFGEDGSFHHCLQQQEGTHVQCEQRGGDEELEVAARTSGEDGSPNFVVDVKFEEPQQVVEFVYLVRADEQEGYYDMNGNPVCHTAHTGPVYHTGPEQRYDEPLEVRKEEELVEVFVCGECGKIQHSEDERKEHAEWHKNKDNECDICQRRFSSKISLMAHGKDHGNKKPFKCDECDKSFPYESTLKAHQRIHTGEKRFVCNICDKHFTHLNALKYHVRVHSGEKPFTCEHCDKAFRSTSTLKKHLRIHTGEKPYKCDVCDKCFLSSSHLSTHKVVHTGLKLYSCQECGKEFAQPASLTYHKRTHTGEKPYGCETCGKHFSSSSYLTEHRRRHTGETPFCCDACGKGFPSSSALTKHRQRAHRGN